MYERNFIVLCESRTGSSMLTSALMSHPQVNMHGELLQAHHFAERNQKRGDLLEFYGLDYSSPGSIIDYLRDELLKCPVNYISKYGFYLGRFTCAGFKSKYEELSHPLFLPVTEFLSKNTNINVIHLRRRNLWHRYKSSFIAINITKKFNDVRRPIDVQTNSIKLDITDIESSFEQSLKWQEHFTLIFRNHNVLNIEYEEFIESPAHSFKKVTAFLSVNDSDWNPSTKKIKPISDSDLISNFEEIKNYFKTTGYAHYFE